MIEMLAYNARLFVPRWMLQIIDIGKTGVFTDLTRPPPEYWDWDKCRKTLFDAQASKPDPIATQRDA